MDVSDGDSDVDSDYDPNLDPEQGEEEGAAINPSERALVSLSTYKRREVNSVFQELRESELNYTKAQLEKASQMTKFGLYGTVRKMKSHQSIKAKKQKSAEEMEVVEMEKGDGVEMASVVAVGGDEKKTVIKASSSSKIGSKNKSKGKGIDKNAADGDEGQAGDKKEVGRRRALLVSMFGKKAAAKMMRAARLGSSSSSSSSSDDNILASLGNMNSSKSKSSKNRQGAHSSSSSRSIRDAAKAEGSNRRHEYKRPGVPESMSAAIKDAISKVATKTRVTETRKFAGQEVTIERTEMMVKSQFEEDERREAEKMARSAVLRGAKQSKGSGSSSTLSSMPPPSAGGGLDDVLDTIKGPKAISTVVKSAIDWDTHKVKEGLEDDLKDASKDGYLTRKDFLNRVDVRTYEKERDARVLKQAGSKK